MGKLIVMFNVPSMSDAQYKQIMTDLKNNGAEHPEGRINHMASEKGSGMVVVDIWESPELLQQFTSTLFPILDKNNVTRPEPEILNVANEVKRPE